VYKSKGVAGVDVEVEVEVEVDVEVEVEAEAVDGTDCAAKSMAGWLKRAMLGVKK